MSDWPPSADQNRRHEQLGRQADVASTEAIAGTLADMHARRGYVLDMHRQLAVWDPDFLDAYELYMTATAWSARDLSRREKELIYVGVLTALAAPAEHLTAHMQAAGQAGVTPRALLQALELTLAPAGVPRFIAALDVFTSIHGQRPSVDDAAQEAAPEELM